jgi:predicted permease
VDLALAVKQSGWDARAGGLYRVRSVLVVSELALSVMLLIGAGLLMKSLWHLWHVDPGFDATNVLGMRISLPDSQYPRTRERAVLYDRIQTLPGIEAAAATNDLPFSGSRTGTSFGIEGVPSARGESRDSDYRTVSSGYFSVMRIPLLQGRAFTEMDNRRETPHVAIINEALKRRYWRNSNPVGHRLILRDNRYEIVGVVGNVRHDDLTAADVGEIYIPQYQGNTPPWTFLAIHSRTSLESLIPAIRNTVKNVAPAHPLYDIRTMQDRVSRSIAPQRFNALALVVFASFALLLATIGIYGVVAFSAERRTKEMGIRMAVGAQPGDILVLVVRQGLALGFLGVVIGVTGALVMSRIIRSMLYGTDAADPLTYLFVSVAFLFIALLASYVPARRAARLDPMVALRWE